MRSFATDNPAFVLSLFDTGLGVARSLSNCGIPVTGIDFDDSMPGFSSKCCRPMVCPHPVNEPGQLLEFLIAEGKKLSLPGILFIASDAFLLFVSRHRAELSLYYRFVLPSEDIVESIANKRRQHELAVSNGIPCPAAFFPENIGDVDRYRDRIDYPAVIKPCYSHQWHDRYPRIKGFKVNSPSEMEKKARELLPSGIRIVVQSIIPGANTSHYKVCAYINERGQTLALFALRKIRQYPVEFGVGTCVESIKSGELIDLGVRFFEGINYRGVGSIEFKRDDRDDALKLIELNPRYWQQNDHARACGMDFPLIHYLDLTGQEPAPQLNYRTGIKWMDPIADFQSFLDHHRNGRLSIAGWMRSFKNVRAFSVWSASDPGPMLKNIEYGWKILKAPFYILKNKKKEWMARET